MGFLLSETSILGLIAMFGLTFSAYSNYWDKSFYSIKFTI